MDRVAGSGNACPDGSIRFQILPPEIVKYAGENTPCSIHALLAFLYKERMNVMGAWSETRMAVAAAKKQGFLPRPLRQLVLDLQQESPNCTDISDLL